MLENIKLLEEKKGNGLPYAYTEITAEADYSVEQASKLLPKMVALAKLEITEGLSPDGLLIANGDEPLLEGAKSFFKNTLFV